MQFTKHGEMFSAKNMAKLAKTVYKCDAKKVKGSHGILNDKKSLLRVIAGKFRLSLNKAVQFWMPKIDRPGSQDFQHLDK